MLYLKIIIGDYMTKKNSLKFAKRRLFCLMGLLIVLVVGIVASVFNDWLQIFDNKHQVSVLTAKYDDLQQQKEQLQSDVNKLQDPDYVARYAREKYLYTKDGELIIRIPKASDSE